jgi:hypothetical protein
MKGIKEPVETSETYVKDNGCLGTRVLHSYVVVLTEKDGANVKAIRIHTQYKKGQEEMTKQIELGFPDWNIKSITRLYEDDFRK